MDVFAGDQQQLVFHFHEAAGGALEASVRVADFGAAPPTDVSVTEIRVAHRSRNPAERQAGFFDLRVDEGVVRGTYDTFGVHTGPWSIVEELMPLSSSEALNLDLQGGDSRLVDFLLSLPGYATSAAEAVADNRLLLGFSVSAAASPTTTTPQVYVTGGALTFDPTRGVYIIRLEEPAGFLPGASVLDDIEAGPGHFRLPVLLSPDGAVTTLPLQGVRFDGKLTADGLVAGVIGGGVPASDISNVLLPALQRSFDETVSRHCDSTTCVAGSAGEFLLDRFDENGDRTISLAELEEEEELSFVLTPDVDLLSGNGPGQDGELDSLSLGFGFESASAEVVVEP